MAKQTPDPKLIDSMAMRYRHDFGLLEETHKEAIRTTMKQLWEEVVGLGFYKDEKFRNSEHLAEKGAVEWLMELYNNRPAYEEFILEEEWEQAKEMQKQQREELALEYFKAGQDSMEEGGKSFDQYHEQTSVGRKSSN